MGARLNRNMSFLDRLLRAVAGVVLIYIGFFATHLVDNIIINLLLGLLGLLNLAAALTAFCPVYKLADFNTEKDNKH
ncbi:MAG: DUF2892 domain-containing protein [Thiohalophilus sp.]|jgi:hypothetical protein